MHRSSVKTFARGFLVAATVGVVAAMSVVGRAYVLNSYKWAPRQVPYYVNPANLDLSEEAAEAAIRYGADAWSTQSNADFQLYYAGRTSGSTVQNNRKNEVFFRNETNGSYVGYTYWWYDGNGNLIDADIIFYDGGFTFFTGTSGCSGGIYLEDVATHEFGHALGLRHSDVSDATMVSGMGWCSQWKRTLAADDIAGIEALYPPGGSTSPPPTAPSNLSAKQNSTNPSSAIDVSWSDPSYEEQVLVERSTNGGSWMQVATLPANSTAYKDGGLSASSTYAYRSRAANSAGLSDYSNTSSASTAAPSAPGTPSNPSPGNGTSNVSWDLSLAWTATNADKVDVYFGTSPTPPLFAANVPNAPFALGRLAQGTTFYWRIVAKNGVGSVEGPVWSFKTKTRGKK